MNSCDNRKRKQNENINGTLEDRNKKNELSLILPLDMEISPEEIIQFEPQIKDEISKWFYHTRPCDGSTFPCPCLSRSERGFLNREERKLRNRRVRTQSLQSLENKQASFPIAFNEQFLSGMFCDILSQILAFIPTRCISRFSMVNKKYQQKIEDCIESRQENKLLVDSNLRRRKYPLESWCHYLHCKINSPLRVFVHYTTYKMGKYRSQYPFWAFGWVDIDPENPHQIVVPYSWKYHGYSLWAKSRSNGSEGRWMLNKKYLKSGLPIKFKQLAQDFYHNLKVGDTVAIKEIPTLRDDDPWWEAQIWYVQHHRNEKKMIDIYDAQNDQFIKIESDKINEHMQDFPLHLVAAVYPTRSKCKRCTTFKRSFFECRIERGHLCIDRQHKNISKKQKQLDAKNECNTFLL